MPIYKRCSRCGKRIPSGSRCSCHKERHKEYDRFSRDKKSKDFYGSKEWERARETAIELDGGIDVYVYMTTGEVLVADTAHHVIPLKDDWGKRVDVDNLMSLNHDTHSVIEQKYRKDKGKMIKQLQEMLISYRKLVRGGGGRLKSFEKSRLTACPLFLTQFSRNDKKVGKERAACQDRGNQSS